MTQIIKVGPAATTEVKELSSDAETPRVGRWYWLSDPDGGEPTFCCVVYIGSNYVKLQHYDGPTVRIHQNEFWDRCSFEPNPQVYIQNQIAENQKVVRALMEEVRDVTARLAVSVDPALPSAVEGTATALSVYAGPSVESYETALVKAKDQTLPELFKKIKEQNELVATWMHAELIPLQAEAKKLEPVIGVINDRIDSVSIYAGLAEHIVQIRDGEPAATAEPLHVFQRKAYMDEECLAQYQTGGMDFKEIEEFDKWLAKPSNADRLLPFPRCVLAFQVRRNAKARRITVRTLFSVMDDEKHDRYTFLYIRNGQQLYRLRTQIEFDHKLYPDQASNILDGPVYWDKYNQTVLSAAEYADKVAAAEEEKRENAERKREEAKKPKSERWFWASDHAQRELQQIEAVTRASVYYDDAMQQIQARMARHNRMVLVLQGLLDRSTVFHPHPPWQIWSTDGFGQALRLIYDDDRALHAGEKPDFEAYRAKLAESITAGSVTIGQKAVWRKREYDRERNRRNRAGFFGESDENDFFYFEPRGGGPGMVSRVFSVSHKGCKYRWLRSRVNSYKTDDKVLDTLVVPTDVLFNVSAYKPGDIRQFFNDPRTRAEYLRWAPYLIVAEEYAAGNIKVQEPAMPPPPKPKKEPDLRAQRRRAHLKTMKLMKGKAVRLRREVTTKGGNTYEVGSLWRVVSYYRGTLSIDGIEPDGTKSKPQRYVSGLDLYDLTYALGIPDRKEEEDDE